MQRMSRFMIVLLALVSFGILASPSKVLAGTSFSIMIDAYPISFALWDSSPQPVYVERQVSYREPCDSRGWNHRHDARGHYDRGRGHERGPNHHEAEHHGHARWDDR